MPADVSSGASNTGAAARGRALAAAALLVCTCLGAFGQRLDLPARIDFGVIDGVASQAVTARNVGDADLKIYRLQASCSCVSIAADARSLVPGAETMVRLTVDPTGRSGPLRRLVSIISNDTRQTARRLIVTAFVKSPAARARAAEDGSWRPGEVLLQLRADRCDLRRAADRARLPELARTLGCSDVMAVHHGSNLCCLRLPAGESVMAAVERLLAHPDVLDVQPNYVYEPRAVVPNDAEFAQQYYHRNTGQSIVGIFGTPGADVQTTDAWSISTGVDSGPGSIVAVLDTGVEYDHPDLATQMWDGTDCVDGNGLPFGRFSFTGTGADDLMGPEIVLYVGGQESVRMTTDCSASLAISEVIGSFKVLGGSSLNGGAFCAQPACDCSGGVTALELQWLGADDADIRVATAGGTTLFDDRVPAKDCIHGYDFTGVGDRDPAPNSSLHGTNLGGIIGAAGNNGIGVAGMAWNIQVMAVRSAGLTSAELIKCLDFAGQNGATVVNASWGWAWNNCSAMDVALYNAIARFPGLVVMAAGNFRNDHDGVSYFDSSDFGHDTICWTGLPNMIGVASTDNRDALAESDYGVNVDVAAPGHNIRTTKPGGNYGYSTGTSFAAPIVAGLAALVWGLRPELTVAEVRAALRQHGDCVELGYPLFTSSAQYCPDGGAKRVNAYRTLAALATPTIKRLRAFTDAAMTDEIVADGTTASTQPYWQWEAPTDQGLIVGYDVQLDGGVVFAGQTSETYFDAAEHQVILGSGYHTLTVVGHNDMAAAGNPVSLGFVIDTTLPIASLSSVPTTVTEGQVLGFRVRLSEAAEQTVAVGWQLLDGETLVGSGSVGWGVGEQADREVAVQLPDDQVGGPDRALQLTLLNPQSAIIINGSATIELTDNDIVSLRVGDVVVDETVGQVMVPVVMTGVSAAQVSVNYATVDVEASAGSDYEAVDGVLTWLPGEVGTQLVAVVITDDALDEDDESFVLLLSSPQNAVLADNSGLVTIIDDDVPVIALAGSTVSEGAGTVTVSLSLSTAPVLPVTARVVTVDETAIGGSDYEVWDAAVAWPAGSEAVITWPLPITDDDLDEADERFTVMLEEVVNATAGQPLTLTIEDDDPPPGISVSVVSAAEVDAVEFVIALSEASGRTIGLQYATASGTAVAGADFVAVSGATELAPGVLQSVVAVPLLNDREDEDDESFTLTIAVADADYVSPDRSVFSAQAAIRDDDFAVPLQAGWNAVGLTLPQAVAEPEAATVQAGDPQALWQWQTATSRFEKVSLPLQSGRGYLAYAGVTVTLSFEVRENLSGLLLLEPGWNLVSPSAQTTVAALGAGVIGDAWGWQNQALVPVTVMERKRAYWIFALTEIVLDGF